MTRYGQLTYVRWQYDGSELAVAATANATTVTVLSVGALDPGDAVWIDGTPGYTISDINGTQLTLTPGLLADADEGVPVVPAVGGEPSRAWYASVLLPDNPLAVEVPLRYNDRLTLLEGTVNPPRTVALSDDLSSITDLPGQQVTIQLSNSELNNGTVPVYDANGNLRQTVGLQSDGTYTTIDQNAPPPPAPADPTVSVGPGEVTVTTYGATVDGSSWPLDLSRLEVHVSATSGFTPTAATKMTEFGENGGTATIVLDSGTWYLVLIAVNTSGAFSPSSNEAMVTVGDPITSAGGVNTYAAGEAPVGLTDIDAGAIWYDTSAGNAPSRWSGTQWVLVQDQTIPTGDDVRGMVGVGYSLSGAVTLSGAVLAPSSPPSVSHGAITPYNLTLPSWVDTSTVKGLVAKDSGVWWTTSTYKSFIRITSCSRSDGHLVTGEVGTTPGTNYAEGITITDDGSLYVLAESTYDGTINLYKLNSINNVSSYQWYVKVTALNAIKFAPGLGSNGNNVIVTYCRTADQTQSRVLTYDPTGAITSDYYVTTNPNGHVGAGRDFIGSNGETRLWIAKYDGSIRVFDNNTHAELPAESYDVGATISGCTYVDNRFYLLGNPSSLIQCSQLFAGNYTTGYSWYDSNAGGTGTHESSLSPTKTTSIGRGDYLQVTTSDSKFRSGVDDPDTTRVYVNNHLQAGLMTPGQTLCNVDTVDTTGAAPLTQGTFPSSGGALGVIQSELSDANGPLVSILPSGISRFTQLSVDQLSLTGASSTWSIIGTSGQPAFANGWSVGSGPTPGFMKDPFGWVSFKGTIGGGTVGSTAFTLPSGYTPAGVCFFSSTGYSASGTNVGQCGIRVLTTGEVQPVTVNSIGFPSSAALNVVRFKAA